MVVLNVFFFLRVGTVFMHRFPICTNRSEIIIIFFWHVVASYINDFFQ